MFDYPVAFVKKHPTASYVIAGAIGVAIFGFWPVVIGAGATYLGGKWLKG